MPLIVYLRVKPLTSAVLFFAVPSLYLLIREPKRLKRILAGTFLIGVIYGFAFDFLSNFNKAWVVPDPQLWFKFRLLGILPADELIWFVLWALFILVFYEHFYEHERSDDLSHHYVAGLIPGILIWGGLFLMFIVRPSALFLKYSYFDTIILSLLAPLYLTLKNPNIIIKLVKLGVFFFCLFFIYELTALYLGQWYFPSHYIGKIEISGLMFPLEELFFWIILSSTVVVCLYEEFVDDGK